MKNVLISLLLVVLLGISGTSCHKIRKLKRKILTFKLIKTAVKVINKAASVISSFTKMKTSKTAMTLYANYLDGLEGIERLFFDSILSVCSVAMNIEVLNTKLLFELNSAKPNSIHAENESEKSLKEASLEELIDRFKQFKPNIKNNQMTEEAKSEAKKAVKMHFSAEISNKIEEITSEIKEIALVHGEIKQHICFGRMQDNIIQRLAKEKESVTKKYEKVAENLQKTRDFIELFTQFRNTESNSKFEEFWKAKIKHFAPKKLETVESKIAERRSIETLVKAVFRLIMVILPFVDKHIYFTVKIMSDIYMIEDEVRSREFVQKAFEILKDFAFDQHLKEGLGLMFGNIGKLIKPSIGISKNAAKSVELHENIDKLTGNLSVSTASLQTDVDNEMRMKSLEIVNMSQIFLMNYQAFKVNSNKLSKNIAIQGEKTSDCADNFYFCALKHGVDYVLDRFRGETVCPKDIFIVEGEHDQTIFMENMFLPFSGTENNDNKFKIYNNYFFSTADSVILKVYIEFNTNEEDIKAKFVKYLTRINAYNNKKVRKEFPSEITVDKIKTKEQDIYIVKATGQALRIRKEFKDKFCTKLEKVFANSTLIKPNLAENISESSHRLKEEHALDLPTGRLEKTLLTKICKVAEKPIKAFSEEEKEAVGKIIEKTIGSLDENSLKSNYYFFEADINSLMALHSAGKHNLKANVIDGLLINYNKVIDENSVKFSLGGKKELQVRFEVRDFSPGDEFRLFNYYSSGQNACGSLKILDNDKEASKITALIKETAGQDLFDGASFASKYYFLDFVSRYVNYTDTVKFQSGSGNFDLTSLLNKDLLISGAGNSDIMLGECAFTFRFVKVLVEGGDKLRFELVEKKNNFSAVQIREAEKGELGFSNEFYVLLYTAGKEKTDVDPDKVYFSINKRLADHEYYALSHLSKTSKKMLRIRKSANSKSFYKIYAEIFVKPWGTESRGKSESICDKIITE